MDKSGFYNRDCMDAMREFPDKFFSLCICDPPYSVNRFKNNQPTRLNKYGNMSICNDLKPTKEYFNELFRISKNQIIWGYNHLSDMLPTTKEFIFWFKHQPVSTYSDGELAWTSFEKTAKCFDYPYFGTNGADKDCRISPCQKPIALYTWILQNYAKRGDKILDTHVGSASSLIACHRMGFEAWGYELDESYFKAATERLEREKAIQPLFAPEEIYKPQQQGIDFED